MVMYESGILLRLEWPVLFVVMTFSYGPVYLSFAEVGNTQIHV